jgi:putative tryptophan/tyrosine transport system substrate-binding protein
VTAKIRRRAFITLIGGAAALPLAARAQQGERVRRIGMLVTLPENDPEETARNAILLQSLEQMGWTVGRNVQFDRRQTLGDAERARRLAVELISLMPDVILSTGSLNVGALLQATQTVPIVFTVVPDPVGAGFVDSLARPGRNATGFTQFDYSISGKWLELLKEIAPQVTRVGVLREPGLTAAVAQFAVIQSVAPSLRVEPVPLNVRDTNEIEQAVRTFARPSGDGLIVVSSPLTIFHRELIIRLAAQHSLPAVYYERVYATGGGLVSYGPDFREQFRRAAGYIDRILKGEKPADLPVQAPTKYEVVINLKTAKALGLEIPQTVLARADEVIE